MLWDVVSFSFFINTAEDFVRISIAFQEIAHDSPDITTRGTAPDRGLIKEVSKFIDQGIADRLACKLISPAHDDVCFLLIFSSLVQNSGKGDAWYSVGDRMLPACPEGLRLPEIRLSRADCHCTARSQETGREI